VGDDRVGVGKVRAARERVRGAVTGPRFDHPATVFEQTRGKSPGQGCWDTLGQVRMVVC
jgi:hypothetical protein